MTVSPFSDLVKLVAAIKATHFWWSSTSSRSRSCCSSKRCQAAIPPGSVCESWWWLVNACKLLRFARNSWPKRESRAHSDLANSKGARLNAPRVCAAMAITPAYAASDRGAKKECSVSRRVKARLTWPYGGFHFGGDLSYRGRFTGCR